MFCGQCGQTNSSGQKFCQGCGVQLGGSARVPAVSVGAQPAYYQATSQAVQPQIVSANTRLHSGMACPTCFNTTYVKKYTIWHFLIAVFTFPFGLLFLCAPVLMCVNGHRFGLGNWIIGIIQTFLALAILGIIAIGYSAYHYSHIAAALPGNTTSSYSPDAVETEVPSPAAAEPSTPIPEHVDLSVDLATPGGVVTAFYGDISAKQYEAAYSLLSEKYQKGTSIAQFAAGYATTQSVAATVGPYDPGTGRVATVLDARDLNDGEVVKSHFVGSWVLVGSGNYWRLDEGSFRRE